MADFAAEKNDVSSAAMNPDSRNLPIQPGNVFGAVFENPALLVSDEPVRSKAHRRNVNTRISITIRLVVESPNTSQTKKVQEKIPRP